MCALGYFPTQLEIKNMTNEVRYSRFSETGEYVDRIGFDDLLGTASVKLDTLFEEMPDRRQA